MLVLTLGTQASASTWAFNVVRKIMAMHRPGALSFFSQDGKAALDFLASGTEDAVIKAHVADQALVNLALIAGGKIIITSRDPRDILVSQHERFDYDARSSCKSLALTLACIASLPSAVAALHLRYEDGFFLTCETITRIAHFIGLPLSADDAQAIFESLQPAEVNSAIATWAATRDNVDRRDDWSPATHWHVGHVGDGAVGKWTERLPVQFQDMAAKALLPMDVDADWRQQDLAWPAELFNARIGKIRDKTIIVPVPGDGQMLLWGPYMFLPTGRWRIIPLIEMTSGQAITLKVDVFTLFANRDVIEMRTHTFADASSNDCCLDIDVLSCFEPLEMRVTSCSDARAGSVRFSGAKLQYLGHCHQQTGVAEHAVTAEG